MAAKENDPVTQPASVPTHGGGVVYQWDLGVLRYLLVTASDDERVWVWPKGHIEPRDVGDASAAARREVAEEAGVSAKVVAPIALSSFTRRNENIVTAYYLMQYVAPVEPLERRKVRWASYAEARQLLSHEDSLRVLLEAQPVLVEHLAAESGFAAQFLMKDYDALTQELERNEGRGETRLSMFMTLVTAVIAGLVTLAASDQQSAKDLAQPISCFGLAALLAIGIVLFLRLLKRNEVTDGIVADLSRLRAIIRKRLDPAGLLGTWYPFKSQRSSQAKGEGEAKRPRPPGGLADMVAVINSILAGALAIVLTAEAGLALVAALVTFGTHYLYEKRRRRRWEADQKASKGS